MQNSKMLRLMWNYRYMYLMLLPGLVYFAIYKYAPMYGTIIAFKDFNIGKGILASPWADPWYKHFKYFIDSPYFETILTNTILISVYKMVWGIAPGIIFAILLNEIKNKFFKRFVQTVTYLPHFLSWVIIYGILLIFMSESTGLINATMKDWGLQSTPFLTSTDWFRSILVGSEIWKEFGWNAIIYLAAISSIDPSLYEASRVDGAGRLRNIWHITLPGIRSVIILLFILKLGHILEAGFDQIYIMYNVQVYPVADILDTYVFRTGLEQLNFSLAAAIGLFKSIIGLVLVLVANKIAKRWGEGIW
ncbi:sugar ABC transporter permease [Paenibacillus sp. PAMC21692]|uniref:ABC transporter permease n=1 Tax=Paenibacillus sp. PAMC21692 TaxID=2762320 RepID=UPI00164E3435|nr:ABC transporter permease subunit [Paenibacillus sp. PAMC21692]QNK57007.1 sugar ABC transporter permease [Paenibacillus sp. PAMC21692]